MAQNIDQMVRLLTIMEKLRDPDSGCPWDVKQTHESLRKYVIEEAYEVVEAINEGDDTELRSELGDLLLQVVFHGEIARDEKRFDFNDIARAISDKMEARHPHVFGDAGRRSVEEQNSDWERLKSQERQSKGQSSALDDVSLALPALTRALKLQKRASRVGFDWDEVKHVRAKIDEEISELEVAPNEEKLGEFGDALFALVNYGRHLGLDPEEALAMTNRKFKRRFEYIETALAKNDKKPETTSLEEMENLWQKAKNQESKP